jgi:hypothetical protein
VEIPDSDCLHVVQIATGATVSIAGAQMTGTIVDLETLPVHTQDAWDALRAQLDLLHERSKALFFHQILTRETIDKLLIRPEYV